MSASACKAQILEGETRAPCLTEQEHCSETTGCLICNDLLQSELQHPKAVQAQACKQRKVKHLHGVCKKQAGLFVQATYKE